MDVFSTVSGEVVKRQLIPSFIPIIPRDQVVHTGDTVLLKCQIRNLGPKSVSWLYKCNMNQGMIPTNYIFDSDLTPIVLTVHGFVFIHTAVKQTPFFLYGFYRQPWWENSIEDHILYRIQLFGWYLLASYAWANVQKVIDNWKASRY